MTAPDTQMTYYHATNGRYIQGEDLLSLETQVNLGYLDDEQLEEILSRWPDAGDGYLGGDGAMVSLTADRAEAEMILCEANGGEGCILEIDGDALDAENLIRTNSEGYPAVPGRIPAWAIKG